MEKYTLTEESGGKERWLADFADVRTACLCWKFIYKHEKKDAVLHLRRPDGTEVDFAMFEKQLEESLIR